MEGLFIRKKGKFVDHVSEPLYIRLYSFWRNRRKTMCWTPYGRNCDSICNICWSFMSSGLDYPSNYWTGSFACRALCSLWSGVYGVESWSAVLEWSGVKFWSGKKWLVFSEPTAEEYRGFDLVTLFGCFHMSCYLKNRAKPFATPKFDSTPLQHSTPK